MPVGIPSLVVPGNVSLMLSATATTLLQGVAALVKKPFSVATLVEAIGLHCTPRLQA